MDTLPSSLCNSDAIHTKLKHSLIEAAPLSNVTFSHERNRRSTGNLNEWKDRYLHKRQRRTIDPTKTTCTLYLQADHLFYQKFYSNEENVIEQLTQHVQGVNEIYSGIGKSDFVFNYYARQRR